MKTLKPNPQPMDIFMVEARSFRTEQAQKKELEQKRGAREAQRLAAERQKEKVALEALLEKANTTLKHILTGDFKSYIEKVIDRRAHTFVDDTGISRFPLPEQVWALAKEHLMPGFPGTTMELKGKPSDYMVTLRILVIWREDTTISGRKNVLALVSRDESLFPPRDEDVIGAHFTMMESGWEAGCVHTYSKSGHVELLPKLKKILSRLGSPNPREVYRVFFEEFGVPE